MLLKGNMDDVPPLSALRAFDVFGSLESVSATADVLNVTPGAVSQQLKKLEESLGLRLIERNGKNVHLTSWGRLYHQDVMKAFGLLRSAKQKVRQAQTEGSIIVSALPSLAHKLFSPKLCDWQSKHPQTQVRLVGSDTEPSLTDGNVDFRVTYGRRVYGFTHYSELFTDTVVPVCAPDLLKANPVRDVCDLFKMPLLGIDWDPGFTPAPDWKDWADSLEVSIREPLPDLSFSHSSFAIDAAIAGRGVVLGQASMIADDLAAGRLVIPVDHQLGLRDPYFLAWDRAVLSKPCSSAMRDWIISVTRSTSLKRRAALRQSTMATAIAAE